MCKKDIISQDFLLDLVAMNHVQEFYKELMNPSFLNKTFSVPETSVKDLSLVPSKHEKAPILRFKQVNTGLCGICSMSSAIEFNFGPEIAEFCYRFRGDYHQHFISESKKKKSPVMSFLKGIIYRKKGNFVLRITMVTKSLFRT